MSQHDYCNDYEPYDNIDEDPEKSDKYMVV